MAFPLPIVGLTADPIWATMLTDAITGITTGATASYTTASLANNARETGTITMAQAFDLKDVTVDRAARVRLYHSTAQRDADAGRARGTLPTATAIDHGCFLEVIFAAAGTITITQGARGWLASGSAVPITIDNLSGATHTVVTGFTYRRSE